MESVSSIFGYFYEYEYSSKMVKNEQISQINRSEVKKN